MISDNHYLGLKVCKPESDTHITMDKEQFLDMVESVLEIYHSEWMELGNVFDRVCAGEEIEE